MQPLGLKGHLVQPLSDPRGILSPHRGSGAMSPFERKSGVVNPRTAYVADRAAALAGVPKSTVHYWARTKLLVPSVSAERTKLWSYEDLMKLRTIEWLRRTKT